MSRYTFNPKIDPNRDRKTSHADRALAFAAILIVGVALFIIGIRGLTSNTSVDRGATPTKFAVAVTIFAQDVTIPAVTAAPQKTALSPQATTVPGATAAQQDNPTTAPVSVADPPRRPGRHGRLRVPETAYCSAGFGYGIQSNWPVGDIGYWNTVMAERLKLNWTKAQVRWRDFQPEAGDYSKAQNNWQLLDALRQTPTRRDLIYFRRHRRT